MWHASVSHPNRRIRRKAAEKVLQGVGDPSLGEWHDEREKAYHIRRRLSEREVLAVGPVVDVRGTQEADDRVSRLLMGMQGAPQFSIVRQLALEEINDA